MAAKPQLTVDSHCQSAENTLLMKEATDGFLKKLQTATLVTPSDALRCNRHCIAASSLTIGDKDDVHFNCKDLKEALSGEDGGPIIATLWN